MKRAKKQQKRKKIINYKVFLGALLVFVSAFAVILSFGGDLFGVNDNPREGQRINLLLTGFDADGLRTDLILVASYDTAKEQADILLIPENTRMYIGGKYQKISAAHALVENGNQKGVSGTVEAVTRLTGIPLNYYIEFSTEVFAKLIDALGGVEFDISEEMYYCDPLQELEINLKKGYQRLDGKECCDLLRYVSYKNGSSRRSEVQTEFFTELAKQKLNPEHIGKLSELFGQMDLNTNLTEKDIVIYANMLLYTDAEKINFYICPGKDEKNGVTYHIPDIDAVGKLVEEIFGYSADNITVDEPKKIK